MKSKIVFGNEKIKESFERLKVSKTEDQQLFRWIERAFSDLEENAFSGIQIPKRLIPRAYFNKFGRLDNLWKYDLPNGWRLIYTIKKDEIILLSVVLEWFDHKHYKRRFGY